MTRQTAWALLSAASLLLTSACSSSTGNGSGATTGSSESPVVTVDVVTSTNVWASVVKAVGGDAVTVTAILEDPSADPHSFEASPKVKLAMSRAAFVVVNGGGYDNWAVDTANSLDPTPTVLNAAASSGLPGAGAGGIREGFNEHVFFSLDAVASVATVIATDLTAADPQHEKTFADNLAGFVTRLDALRTEITAIRTAHPGVQVLATEPLPGYLVEAFGFTDATPAGFSEAVEADTEVPVQDLAAAKALLTSHAAALLFNNVQTGGPVVDQLLAVASTSATPVIGVSETLPAGVTDYLAWMQNTVVQVKAALGA